MYPITIRFILVIRFSKADTFYACQPATGPEIWSGKQAITWPVLVQGKKEQRPG